MKLHRMFSLPLVVALASGLGACQDGRSLLGPEAASPPIAAQGTPGLSMIEDRTSEVGGVTAVIGSQGGELKLGNQSLVVPAGAVDAPTLFRMKKGSRALSVIITATRETLNDVGNAGFATPLTLSFRYGNAASLPAEPSQIQIVWVRPDGTFDPQPTTVDLEARVISAEITHLSEYALASN